MVHNYSTAHIRTMYQVRVSGNLPHEDVVVERKKGGESALENMFPESPDLVSWVPVSRQHRQGAVKHHAKHETKADRIEVKHRLGGYLKSLQQQH